MGPKKTSSLQAFVMSQVRKWSTIGLVLSMILGCFLVFFFGIKDSEKQITTIAQGAVKAFRSEIIEGGDISKIEPQIRDAFKLGNDETVVIRETNLKPIYDSDARSMTETKRTNPSCMETNHVCWDLKRRTVGLLFPIYFEERTKEVFGYLDLSIHPVFNIPWLLSLLFLICLGFIIQVLGLSIKLNQTARFIGNSLSFWANHIKTNPKEKITTDSTPPFTELIPMQEALEGLHLEIERLERIAKYSAQLTIIRGIAHDILSPVSQIQKYVSSIVLSIQNSKKITRENLEDLQRSIDNLTSIAKDVRTLQNSAPDSKPKESQSTEACDLNLELKLLARDYMTNDDVKRCDLKIEINSAHKSLLAKAAPFDCYRIFDNLIRNALQASHQGGTVKIHSFLNEEGLPAIAISDEGVGISLQNQKKTFDADFSTKAGKGTGLGLTVVKELCEKNDARLEFATMEGRGTTFQIYFQKPEPRESV